MAYPLSNSPRNHQVNRIPSSSSLSPTSPNNIVNQNQFLKATNYKYTTTNNNNKSQNNNNNNNRINNNNSGNTNRTDSPTLSSNNTLKQSELENINKVNENNNNNSLSSDNLIEKQQQPPLPPDSALTNNVDEIAMLDNVIDIETKDGNLMIPTSNNKQQDNKSNHALNEDDGDKLVRELHIHA